GDGVAVPQRVLEQPRGGHLRRRRFGRAAVQLTRQVRIGHRLAELHQAAGAGERRHEDGLQAALPAERSALEVRRLPPRPRLRRWPAPHGAALLHELRGDALHSREQARGGRLWSVREVVRGRDEEIVEIRTPEEYAPIDSRTIFIAGLAILLA